jgi:hypothetical protein
VAPLCAAQLVAGVLLYAEWRRGGPEALVPDCARVLEVLRGRHLVRAYASYHTAYCLTYTSAETVVASPPWNERFWGYPLPYLDEVRREPRAAWVLVPGVDFQLPAPHTFAAKVAGIGGRFTHEEAGPAAVYYDFVPPFPARAMAAGVDGPAGDADVTTRVVQPPGPATFPVAHPQSVAGLTLLAGTASPDLPRAMDLEVSPDGVRFERIGRRRRGRETVDLAWVNGHPQFLVDDLAFSVPLDGRMVAAVRITPIESSPWSVSEVLLHPAASSESEAAPGVDADALYRSVLAHRR